MRCGSENPPRITAAYRCVCAPRSETKLLVYTMTMSMSSSDQDKYVCIGVSVCVLRQDVRSETSAQAHPASSGRQPVRAHLQTTAHASEPAS